MKKMQKGFTLVELIVVIAVIALLAVGAMVAFRGVRAAALDEAVSADANRIKSHGALLDSTVADAGGLASFIDNGEHAFCPVCGETGTPGSVTHDPDCTSEIVAEIVWEHGRTQSDGATTAWMLSGR